MNIKKLQWWIGGGRSWYVRPSGGSYGTEDGTSYANAWDGFANIVWASIKTGDTLYVAGTHTELLIVGASQITVASLIADAGIIDGGSSIAVCLAIDSRTNVTIRGLSLINATTSCADIFGTSSGIVFRDVIASGSGNQAYQCRGSASITFYNCQGNTSVDDGMSLEGSAVVVAYDSSFTGNDFGLNAINTAIFTGYRCTFTGNVSQQIQPDGAADFTLNSCFITGAVTANSSVSLKLNNCRFTNSLITSSATHTCIINDSRLTGTSSATAGGTLTMNRCYISSTTTRTIANSGSGVVTVNYCVFKMSTDIYAFRPNAATGTFTVNNCDVIGNGNLGRSVDAARTITLNNCNFYDLNIALVTTGSGIITTNNCNSFDITTQTSGINITQNASIALDPQYVDISGDNFATGANTKNVGTSTGVTTGISTAVWGDASTAPVVTTAEQAGTYDLGAYI